MKRVVSVLWRPGPPILMYFVLVVLLFTQMFLTRRGISQKEECLQRLNESRRAADDLLESDQELKAAEEELKNAVDQIVAGRGQR